jgi:hypothetical protein
MARLKYKLSLLAGVRHFADHEILLEDCEGWIVVAFLTMTL